MKLTIYQIDAFTNTLFGGNPAAVIPLEQWIDESLMQKIALENNLSETVFFVPENDAYAIRWFTPEVEINLCGHATLASAWVLFNILEYKKKEIVFYSKTGPLFINREDDFIYLNFPSWNPERITEFPDALLASLNHPEIAGVYRYRDYLVELTNEEAVKKCQPDFTLMRQLNEKVIITAPGKNVDFVSRFFAPTAGVNEDPVTGSAHSQLIPFWSYKLNKEKMQARQLSARGGYLYCEQKGERVIMGGQCVFYMKGEIQIL